MITSSVAEFGHRWNRIAERLPKRTEHAIRNRWHRLQTAAMEEAQASTSVLTGNNMPTDIGMSTGLKFDFYNVLTVVS